MARYPFASAAFAAFLVVCVPVITRAAGDVQISGSLVETESTFAFSCSGTPTCTGVYTKVKRLPECNAPLSQGGVFTITGINISQPGTFSGSLFVEGGDRLNANSVNGVCSPTYADITAPYSGTWDGATGTLTVLAPDGAFAFPFKASVSSAPPVFPMAVTASITPTVTNVSATIQPRSQDAGQSGGIFVFAHAPASKVRGAKRASQDPTLPVLLLDDPDPCVLAQVDGTGALTAVSAATMLATLNGTLSSQGQAVSVLNNVATPNVAGATMYVGYGANAATMLGNGIYQGAVTIPGIATCSAPLATAAAPTSPAALSGLWWNATESGWGIHFTQRRNIVFAAWYTYDTAGNPKWYVASNCTLPSGTTGTSGMCTGSLFEVTGPAFFGAAFNTSLVHASTAGNLSVTFQNANAASMTYTVAGQTRTVSIVRQEFGSGLVAPAIDYTDLWWNPSESGWGIAIAHRFGIVFLAWYVYDNAGKPVWYVVPNCPLVGTGCSGALYRTTGPAFGPVFDPSRVTPIAAGNVTVTFDDANNGTLSYTVNGVAATKAITRQTF